MKCEKFIRVIMRPIRKKFPLMKVSLKEAKKRVFMGLKRLSKVFSRKEETFLRIFCAFLMNEM